MTNLKSANLNSAELYSFYRQIQVLMYIAYEYCNDLNDIC